MNGYEIRAQILAIAKDYMDNQVRTNIRFLEEYKNMNAEMFDKLKEIHGIGNNLTYTPEELIKTAHKFYSEFVDKKI
jgi:hypothetical protein